MNSSLEGDPEQTNQPEVSSTNTDLNESNNVVSNEGCLSSGPGNLPEKESCNPTPNEVSLPSDNDQCRNEDNHILVKEEDIDDVGLFQVEEACEEEDLVDSPQIQERQQDEVVVKEEGQHDELHSEVQQAECFSQGERGPDESFPQPDVSEEYYNQPEGQNDESLRQTVSCDETCESQPSTSTPVKTPLTFDETLSLNQPSISACSPNNSPSSTSSASSSTSGPFFILQDISYRHGVHQLRSGTTFSTCEDNGRKFDSSNDTFGHVEKGIPGTVYRKRAELRESGVHVSHFKVCYSEEGVTSLILDGQFEHLDIGYHFLIPVADKKGQFIPALHNAYMKNKTNQLPIRVIRTSNYPRKSPLRPNLGYRYDGIYQVRNEVVQNNFPYIWCERYVDERQPYNEELDIRKPEMVKTILGFQNLMHIQEINPNICLNREKTLKEEVLDSDIALIKNESETLSDWSDSDCEEIIPEQREIGGDSMPVYITDNSAVPEVPCNADDPIAVYTTDNSAVPEVPCNADDPIAVYTTDNSAEPDGPLKEDEGTIYITENSPMAEGFLKETLPEESCKEDPSTIYITENNPEEEQFLKESPLVESPDSTLIENENIIEERNKFITHDTIVGSNLDDSNDKDISKEINENQENNENNVYKWDRLFTEGLGETHSIPHEAQVFNTPTCDASNSLETNDPLWLGRDVLTGGEGPSQSSPSEFKKKIDFEAPVDGCIYAKTVMDFMNLFEEHKFCTCLCKVSNSQWFQGTNCYCKKKYEEQAVLFLEHVIDSATEHLQKIKNVQIPCSPLRRGRKRRKVEIKDDDKDWKPPYQEKYIYIDSKCITGNEESVSSTIKAVILTSGEQINKKEIPATSTSEISLHSRRGHQEIPATSTPEISLHSRRGHPEIPATSTSEVSLRSRRGHPEIPAISTPEVSLHRRGHRKRIRRGVEGSPLSIHQGVNTNEEDCFLGFTDEEQVQHSEKIRKLKFHIRRPSVPHPISTSFQGFTETDDEVSIQQQLKLDKIMLLISSS